MFPPTIRPPFSGVWSFNRPGAQPFNVSNYDHQFLTVIPFLPSRQSARRGGPKSVRMRMMQLRHIDRANLLLHCTVVDNRLIVKVFNEAPR
jgi:hypothetical protein